MGTDWIGMWWMVIIGLRSSKSTYNNNANAANNEIILPTAFEPSSSVSPHQWVVDIGKKMISKYDDHLKNERVFLFFMYHALVSTTITVCVMWLEKRYS